MSTYGPGDPGASPPMDDAVHDDVHETVGAYALGLLEPAEATAFEEHLAGCERCARMLDELVGLGPALAPLADLPDPAPGTPPTSSDATPGLPAIPTPTPSPGLADRLLVDVAADRARRRRRARYLVAGAAVLIVAGPLVTLGVSGDTNPVQPPPDSVALRNMPERVHATDAGTKVSATLGLVNTPWGTDTVLELKNLKGPENCSLDAVGDDGSRQTMTSWSVPGYGYGIPNSKNPLARLPLYVRGTAAFDLHDIDHFEVQTLDGKHLVTVNAPSTR